MHVSGSLPDCGSSRAASADLISVMCRGARRCCHVLAVKHTSRCLPAVVTAGLPELAPQEPDTEYPASITLGMLGVVVANMALFCLTCWLSFRFWRWLFALFGPAQPVALAAAAGYLALAFWLYSRPVNALQLHAEKRRPGQLAQSATNVAALDGKKAS